MISASHNPMPDNGIKLFAAGGHKLPDGIEDEIEAGLAAGKVRPTGAGVGRVHDVEDAAATATSTHLLERDAALARRAEGRRRLRERRVVGRRARGLPPRPAPRSSRCTREPDGVNINEHCGSNHPEQLREAVVEHGADLGIAHDGDADRCLAVDSAGELVDGDQIMAVLALALRESGELAKDTLVATVMSNLGLHLAMRAHGISRRHDGGRRPVRAGGAAVQRLRPRRRAVRPRRAPGARHHRRRRC